MIDREKIKFYENILSLHNSHVDLSNIDNLIKAINEDHTHDILTESVKMFNDIEVYKAAISDALTNAKHEDEYRFYSNLLPYTHKDLDIHLLTNVLHAMRQYKDSEKDILDSFSNNQLKAKNALITILEKFNILDSDMNVTIWGSWYGSILIPKLYKKVSSIYAIDLDERVGKISKNLLFRDYEHLNFVVGDVFEYKKDYLNTNLFINTSCEHMKPMKEWKWFGPGAMSKDKDTSIFATPKIPDKCYFAFQSNNMFGIEGHINCVESLDDFKDQLPDRAEVLYEEEVEDTRGTRYMLIGKFMPL